MTKSHRVALAAVVIVALLSRFAVLFERSSDILFDTPALDEQRYVDLARELAAGGTAPVPYWQPPGLLFVLTACFKLAGDGLWLPHLLQVLVSTAVCLLLFVIGRRLFDPLTGVIAAAVGALHGILILASFELLPATWILFVDLVALLLLLHSEARRTLPSAFVAGLFLGIAAIFSPTILPFALVAVLWLIRRSERRASRRILFAAVFAAGVAAPIAPVTWHNRSNDEWVLISGNGGLNLYLGNNADYRETFALRPGRHWLELLDEPNQAGAKGHSRYFADKALSYFRESPGAAAALLLRKAYLFFHAAEVPRDTDVYAARETSMVLAALVWPGPIWFPGVVLIPLALVGMGSCWGERRRLFLLYAFLAVQAAVLTLFFVSARHRVPALGAFALFAAAGAVETARRWRASSGRRRGAMVALGAALAAALSPPLWETRLSLAGEYDFYRGLAHLEAGDMAAAIRSLRGSTRKNPNDPRAWRELGNLLAETAGEAEAVSSWRRAAALDPWDDRPARRAADVLARRDPDAAIAVLRDFIDAGLRDPAHYAADRLRLALLYLDRRRYREAIDQIDAAARAHPDYCRTHLPGLFRLLAKERNLDERFRSDLAAIRRRLGLREQEPSPSP